MTEATISMDDLLDGTLDDLADLSSFEPFHAGTHHVRLTLTKKEINKHPAIEASLVLLDTIELSDAALEPQKEGSKASTAFMLDNDIGQGKFKAIAKTIAAATGASTIRDVIEATNGGWECNVLTKVRTDDKDKDDVKKYLDIVKVFPL